MDAVQLAALEDELKRDLDAVARVRRLMEGKTGGIGPTLAPADRERMTEAVNEDDQEDLDYSPVTSLRGKIEEVINHDPSVKWTTQRVLAHLQRTGFPLRAKKPVYSVGQSLHKLAEKGRIRLVRKGNGSAPNIYKGRITEHPEEHNGNGQMTGEGINREFELGSD
jgi:hypothetical protein